MNQDARTRRGAEGRWARVQVGLLDAPISVLVVDPAELAHVDLDALGFARLGTGASRVPRIVTLAADVSRDHEVELCQLAGSEIAAVVARAVFASPHPEEWSDVVHDGGQLTVLVASIAALQGPRPEAALDGAPIAALPLAVRACSSERS